MTLHHWLMFAVAFLIILAGLTILAAVQEYLEWRKSLRRKP